MNATTPDDEPGRLQGDTENEVESDVYILERDVIASLGSGGGGHRATPGT
jgi:hypothetical protein